MFDRGLWTIVPARPWSSARCTPCTSSQSSVAYGASRSTASASSGPSATWTCTPDPVLDGEVGRGCDGVVRAGEGGMEPDHPPAAVGQETAVLLQPPAGPVGPVSVGHPVGAHHPHPDLGAGVGDHRQRTVDRVGRLVVVDDRRAPDRQRFQRPQPGRPGDRVEVEGLVQPPPDQLQDLPERRGRPRRRRHPAGQRRVQVVVGADQPGRDGGGPHYTDIGSCERHWPSWAWRAAATAPAVGTRPISPTPLMP